MHDELEQDDALEFDRLVDGELSADERRRLLSSLDDRPGGWRQCALAFLEAQSWREDLRQVVREGEVAASGAPVRTKPSDSSRSGSRITALAIAAGVLVACTIGFVFRDGKVAFRSAATGASEQIAERNEPSSAATLSGVTPDATSVDDALTLWVRDETGERRSLRVPLVDAGALDSKLGLEFQTGLPANVRHQLEQRGYEVQSKRRYAPLSLENGRQMIVPVEDTRIVPVSAPVY
jgi:hypothetical protein